MRTNAVLLQRTRSQLHDLQYLNQILHGDPPRAVLQWYAVPHLQSLDNLAQALEKLLQIIEANADTIGSLVGNRELVNDCTDERRYKLTFRRTAIAANMPLPPGTGVWMKFCQYMTPRRETKNAHHS